MGVPKKQIIITGHSCGAYDFNAFAKYPNAAGGGISFNQACFGKFQKDKAAKVGPEAVLEKVKNEDQDLQLLDNHKLMKLKMQKIYLYLHLHTKRCYEGLLSDWLDEIPGLYNTFEDYTINGQKCF